jgi:O-antigen biosynthesis protein
MLGISITIDNDNDLSFITLFQFIQHTDLTNINYTFYVLLKNCSDSFKRAVESIKNTHLTILNNESDFELTHKLSKCEYCLQLINEWYIDPTISKSWLQQSITYLKNNQSVSSIYVRKNNEDITSDITSDITFEKVSQVLLDYHPMIKRNNSNGSLDVNNGLLNVSLLEDENCVTYTENGISGIFINDVVTIQKRHIGPYSSSHMVANVNCHIPILVILNTEDNLIYNYIFTTLKHSFIRPLYFYFRSGDVEEYSIETLKKTIVEYSPKCFITIGDRTVTSFKEMCKFSYETRKRWLHFDDYSKIRLESIEKCIFQSFYKHPFDKENPLITVITPTFESKHRIYRPYNSLLRQTYSNWEWIIIDDSNTGETWDKLQQFASNDCRIKIYKRHKNDGYIGNNKYFCSSLAKGKLIFELDHDDDIVDYAFDRLVCAYKKYPEAGFFYSDCIEGSEPDENGYVKPFNYGSIYSFGFGSYYRQWTKGDFQYVGKASRMNPHTFRYIIGVPNHFRCWSKDAYISVGSHNTHLSVVDDYELIIRTMFKYRWVHIPEPLYIQYRNDGGNNFTFHRNALIQYLTTQVRWTHEEDIHNRLVELGVNDNKHYQNPGHPNDYLRDTFEYPILEYVFKVEDQKIDSPLISIVVPTYNNSYNLPRVLDSIFNQSYQNFEILVIGNKCPYLDSFVYTYPKAKDKRFKFYNLLETNGPDNQLSLNYAIKMISTSKWITYFEPDHNWTTNHLQLFVNKIREQPSIEFIFGSMHFQNEKKDIICNEAKENFVQTSAVMHTFDLCVKNGLWKNKTEAGYNNDWEFFTRITENWTREYSYTGECTLLYNNDFTGLKVEDLETV